MAENFDHTNVIFVDSTAKLHLQREAFGVSLRNERNEVVNGFNPTTENGKKAMQAGESGWELNGKDSLINPQTLFVQPDGRLFAIGEDFEGKHVLKPKTLKDFNGFPEFFAALKEAANEGRVANNKPTFTTAGATMDAAPAAESNAAGDIATAFSNIINPLKTNGSIALNPLDPQRGYEKDTGLADSLEHMQRLIQDSKGQINRETAQELRRELSNIRDVDGEEQSNFDDRIMVERNGRMELIGRGEIKQMLGSELDKFDKSLRETEKKLGIEPPAQDNDKGASTQPNAEKNQLASLAAGAMKGVSPEMLNALRGSMVGDLNQNNIDVSTGPKGASKQLQV